MRYRWESLRRKIAFPETAMEAYVVPSIEFRVMRLNDLKALFKSAQGSWESNQGKKVTLK